MDDHDVTEFDSMNFETSSQIGDQTLDICAEYLEGISYEKEYVGIDKTVENIVAARANRENLVENLNQPNENLHWNHWEP